MRSPSTGHALTKQPRPLGSLYTVKAVAYLIRRTPRTVTNLLSIHRDRLGPAIYQQAFYPKDRRLYRVLTEADLLVLREMYPVYVKEKPLPRPPKSRR